MARFANIEEDFADQAVWATGSLGRDKHLMPWRIEDELTKLGACYIQAGLWKGIRGPGRNRCYMAIAS